MLILDNPLLSARTRQHLQVSGSPAQPPRAPRQPAAEALTGFQIVTNCRRILWRHDSFGAHPWHIRSWVIAQSSAIAARIRQRNP